jgi:hypothetical protein
MFEHNSAPVLPFPLFMLRLCRSLGIGLIALFISLGIGMWGYHFYEHLPWVDSFVNASMILSGMGPLNPLFTAGGKIFAGCYALYSGLIFIIITGIILAPIIHRFFHKLHHKS